MRKFICHLTHKASGEEEIEVPMWADDLDQALELAEDTYSHFYEVNRVRPVIFNNTQQEV